MSRFSITRLLQPGRGGGGHNLNPFDLAPTGRSHGIYLAGAEHERRQALTVAAPLFEVLSRVQSHVRNKLGKWQKSDEVVLVDKPGVTVLYDHKFSESFPLVPRTFRARWNVASERQKTRRHSIVRSIPYEVELRLAIEQQSRAAVLVDACITEKIDPRGNLADYPIGHHFWAPSAIHTLPWFDELLAAVQSGA
jgi:hypothetical protein